MFIKPTGDVKAEEGAKTLDDFCTWSRTLTCSECVIKCYFVRTHEEEVEAGESVQINMATKA